MEELQPPAFRTRCFLIFFFAARLETCGVATRLETCAVAARSAVWAVAVRPARCTVAAVSALWGTAARLVGAAIAAIATVAASAPRKPVGLDLRRPGDLAGVKAALRDPARNCYQGK